VQTFGRGAIPFNRLIQVPKNHQLETAKCGSPVPRVQGRRHAAGIKKNGRKDLGLIV
jgi:hypothetical protein